MTAPDLLGAMVGVPGKVVCLLNERTERTLGTSIRSRFTVKN